MRQHGIIAGSYTPDRILKAIPALTDRLGKPPIYREIAEYLGDVPLTAVYYWVGRLEADGRVIRQYNKPRTMRVIEQEQSR